MPSPSRVPRWAAYALLFGLYLTVRGYHSRDGDQAYRLPLLLHWQDPALYGDDPFVRAVDAFNPHAGYLALLDISSRPLGLSFALFALFATTFGLTCAGVSRLARSLWRGGPDAGLIAVALILLAKAGNVGTNHLFEATLLDRQIGFGLGWLALALAIEGEGWRPSLLVGLAAVVHPSVGLQLGGLIGAGWVVWSLAGRRTGRSWRDTLIALGTLSVALIPGVLPTIGLGGRLFEGLSPGEFRRLGVELQMAQHMVPSLWRRGQWLAWGSYIALGIVSVPAGWAWGRRLSGDGGPRPTPREKHIRFVILSGVLLAGLGVAYLGIERAGSLKLTVFQPFRMATIARGLALIALAGRVGMLWSRGDFEGKARASLLLSGLGGDWAFVVATAVELAFTAGSVLRDGLGRTRPRTVWSDVLPGSTPHPNLPHKGEGLPTIPPPLWGRLGWGVSARARELASASMGPLTLTFGLVFLARHDTERGQIPLLIGLGLAILAWLVRSRYHFVWNARRLALAAVVCWAVPAAALVAPWIARPDDRLVQVLVGRCRFGATPTDDVERLAAWARAETPTDARFITPPGPKTFRLWSARSVAFNRAASPYHAEGLKDWADRFRAHVGFDGTTAEFVHAYLADRHGVEAGYNRLTLDQLARLAASQGADHVLAAAPRGGEDGPLRLLKVEGRYAIYRVDRERLARTAESPTGNRSGRGHVGATR